MNTVHAALKITILCIAFTLIGIALYFFCPQLHPGNPTPSLFTAAENDSPVFIIDAGHGGEDGGALAADGTPEKELNLAYAESVAAFLRYGGYTAELTRTDDTMLGDGVGGRKKQADLTARIEKARSYENAYLVSIHMNKFPDTRCRGTQIWYSCGDARSKQLAKMVQDTVKRYLQSDNRRECKPATSAIYILHKADMPAILVECGFISNSDELELLKDNEYRKKFAAVTAAALINGVQYERT